MIGDMCNEINFDIHFCRDEETHFACELATMQDFESVHPDSSVTCHQDLKSWDTFYHVASRLIGECTTIVAVEDGKVIGVANYICSSAYGTINYLYVLPKCRHQGIGNALLKRAEEHMATTSICFARAPVNLFGDSAIAFCKKMGYSERKKKKKKRIKPLKEATAEASNSSPNGCDECGL